MIFSFLPELALKQIHSSVVATIPRALQANTRLVQAIHGYLLSKQLLSDWQTAYVSYILYPPNKQLDVKPIATALWQLLNALHSQTFQLQPVFAQLNSIVSSLTGSDV